VLIAFAESSRVKDIGCTVPAAMSEMSKSRSNLSLACNEKGEEHTEWDFEFRCQLALPEPDTLTCTDCGCEMCMRCHEWFVSSRTVGTRVLPLQVTG
jgi:hypothetical protein